MKIGEMFSGIGGFRFGLEKNNQDIRWRKDTEGTTRQEDLQSRRIITDPSDANSKHPEGFRCVWANDWDKYAYQIYRKHYGEKELVEGNVTKIEPKDIPDFDLLTAGFPCQSFSLAGKRKGLQDIRGTMFYEVVRVASAKKPKLLLLENVKGLLSNDNGKTFGTILEELGNIGYWCEWQTLNSKHFGVPQNRERVFIVGHSRSEPTRQIFPISGEVVEFSSEPRKTEEGLCEVSFALKARDYSNWNGTYVKEDGSENLIQIGELWEGSQCRVYDPNGISPTLHKSGGNTEPMIANTLDTSGWLRKQGRHEIGKHGLTDYRIRRLTPTECERLQGFPDGWTEGVSDTQRYKLLGNAVTTNVIEFLGKCLLSEGSFAKESSLVGEQC